MATTKPNPETTDFEVLIEKYTDENIDIDQHFTAKELRDLSEYEKARLRNVKSNYLMLSELGFPAKMPDFMQKKKRSSKPGAKAKAKKVKGESKKKREPLKKKVVSTDTEKTVELKKNEQKKAQPKKERTDKRKIIKSKSPHVGLTSKVLQECSAKSEGDPMEFAGFSISDIEESEKCSREQIERNDAHLSQLESGTLELDHEKEEEEAEEKYEEVVCDECGQRHEGDCPLHGSPITIEDTKVLTDRSDAARAVHSLPKGLVIKPSNIPGAGNGVWTEMDIAKGVRFGPYEGIEVTDRQAGQMSGYCWMVYPDGEISHCVDAEDGCFGNWLRFVNCAHHELEQNLLAYQYQGNIFYKTVKAIGAGTELFVWYGDKNTKEQGIPDERSALHALYRNAGFEVWECEVCGKIFSTRNWLSSHNQIHGDRSGSKKYKCEDCMYSTDRIGCMTRHRRTHSGERPYCCTVCDFRTARVGTLKQHMRIHSNEKPYKCTMCDYRAIRSGTLKQHMRTHTGEKPFKCTVCDYRAVSSGTLKQHMRTHTGEKPFKCTVCDYRAISSGTLKQHMRMHTGEKPYKCTVCNRSSQVVSLKQHMRTHTVEKAYKCTVSDYLSTEAENLKRHMGTHTGEKPYKCTMCDFVTVLAATLVQHLRTHTGEKPYSCTVCDFRTKCPGTLKRHMGTHSEKPYRCTECDYQTTLAGSLKKHVRTHTNVKPYSCTLCDFRTSWPGSLKPHMRTHTGEKPYSCSECDYRTSWAGSLKGHMRRHTGEKPYTCTVCDQKFTSSCSLKQHINRHQDE